MTSADRPVDLAIEKLRQLTQVSVQSNWHYWEAEIKPNSNLKAEVSKLDPIAPNQTWQSWPVAELNSKAHISWLRGRRVLWLRQKIVVPHNLHGYPLEGLALRLSLAWWAEDVQIFVNDRLVGAGDLFDYFTRVLLSESVIPGEEFSIALRLVSPNHDSGALVRSICIYESNCDRDPEPGFVADELAVLQRYSENLYLYIIDVLTEAIGQIDWSALPDRQKFDRSLSNLRQNLQSKIPKPQSKIYLLGHAHLDLAWLWPVSETWIAAQRTFASVLQLQPDFPNLIFCHSTPALYAWIEEHRPDLFAAIQKQVNAGRWEIVGGMWVEPDLNLIDGESIVRQILYGQRYVKSKFQQLSKVAWVPDSFGFCATLPQFLQAGGIEYFVTQKLRWNDTTKFPYGVFWWQSPDGSQIFSFMSALIGENIDPIKMATYAVDWQSQTNLKDALWLPGVGDHGGGPTRDMLEVAQRWEKSPFFPELEFSGAGDYLQKINAELNNPNQISIPAIPKTGDIPFPIPIWKDELYLEFHRGCYTTHADQKRSNRRCEGWLYRSELFASLANIVAGLSYPKIELENAWKKVLFNQFHDILPGTSIPEVFVEANRAWQEVERVGEEIWQKSIGAIASRISLPPPPQPDALPILVFNSLNWERSEVVAVNLPASHPSWQLCDADGKPLIGQCVALGERDDGKILLFSANNVPSIGYRLFWLYPQTAEMLDVPSIASDSPFVGIARANHNISILDSKGNFVNNNSLPSQDWVLENQFIRVEVNPESGNLARIFDKITNREILDRLEANQLQSFQDSGQYWDAWNIDPNYERHPLPDTEIKSIQWVYRGEIQQRLQVVRQLGKSQFYQDYILDTESPILKIITSVDWQENQVLVKAAFPFNLTADYVTCEIPCGAINRPTQPQEPREKAKWEIPALRWASLSTDDYSVSILNDCKYGYDAKPSQLRLTLLRSPNWPEEECDRGYHQFTYAIYPYPGNWQSARTVRRGYELNLPLQVTILPAVKEKKDSFLPPTGKLLDLSAENLILIAFKQAEDNPQEWILRCYECHGEPAELKLAGGLDWKITESVDLLERSVERQAEFPDRHSLPISPWKIVSLKVTPEINK